MSKAEFLADLRSARSELEEILARQDEKANSEAVVPGLSWTTNEQLAHLIGYDLAVLKAIADVRAGQQWAWGWTSPNFDDWNESQVWPRRSRSYASVRAESTPAAHSCSPSWNAGRMMPDRSVRRPGTGRRAPSAG